MYFFKHVHCNNAATVKLTEPEPSLNSAQRTHIAILLLLHLRHFAVRLLNRFIYIHYGPICDYNAHLRRIYVCSMESEQYNTIGILVN